MAKPLSSLLFYRELFTSLLLVGSVLFFISFTPNTVFIGRENLGALGKLIPELGIVALSVGVLMICGEFDLSVSSSLPLCAYIFMSSLQMGLNLFFATVFAFVAGALVGLLNALITVKGQIPSFITTLGTMMLWRGILYVYSMMWPIPLRPYMSAGSAFENAFVGQVGGVVPVQVVWFAVFAVFLGMLLHLHKFGNWIYATGDNKEAARAMGINTDRVKTICFMMVGISCAFVAIMQTFRLESFCSTQGIGYELRTITASVVGGTSLRGGIGSMTGILLGAVITQIIENGLILIGAPAFGIDAFIGTLIVIFVLLDSLLERKRMSIR